MSQMWFTKIPGQISVNEEENAVLFGDCVPDYVRTPPELGGEQVRVLEAFTAPCPVTKQVCRHLKLENGLYVAESDQFYWYKCKTT